MTRRHFPLWTLLGVVLVVALLFGSGAFASAPPTNAERASSIEQIIRCPSCEDLSVAVSSAPTAVTVRATVDRLVGEGRSDQQIENFLVARYGSAIVLDPPTSGWAVLVWLLPVVVGFAAVVALAAALTRRRRQSDADLDADLRSGTADAGMVDERRRFLLQSLADADAEYLAGDLSDVDYLRLRQRDLARLGFLGPIAAGVGPAGSPAAVTAAGTTTTVDSLESATSGSVATATLPASAGVPSDVTYDGDAAVAPERGRRGRNRWFLVGAVVCFVAALILAVPLFTSVRLPGETATGSVALSPSQQLARSLDQAATVENEGQLGQAAQLYQQILTTHPDDEVALAQLGWLEYRVGQDGSSASLISDARAKLEQAAALAPDDYAVHLYLGTVLLDQDGNAAGAADQYRLFLADDPPSSVLDQASATLRTAFTQAGQPVPAGVPAG
ncbi:MAG: cytochrome c-type biogenesis protein CcmH [Acidimicrobiales bacterium]|jgi:cytochrome c-type biogenesis protein CcmH